MPEETFDAYAEVIEPEVVEQKESFVEFTNRQFEKFAAEIRRLESRIDSNPTWDQRIGFFVNEINIHIPHIGVQVGDNRVTQGTTEEGEEKWEN